MKYYPLNGHGLLLLLVDATDSKGVKHMKMTPRRAMKA